MSDALRERNVLPWFCVDCNVPRELDRHGRCDVCGSEAVVLNERLTATVGCRLGNVTILPELRKAPTPGTRESRAFNGLDPVEKQWWYRLDFQQYEYERS